MYMCIDNQITLYALCVWQELLSEATEPLSAWLDSQVGKYARIFKWEEVGLANTCIILTGLQSQLGMPT